MNAINNILNELSKNVSDITHGITSIQPLTVIWYLIDIILMYALIKWLYKEMPFVKETGLYKYYRKLLFFTIIMWLLGFKGSEFISKAFFITGLLLPAFLYPNAFKKVLEDKVGRVVTEERKETLLSADSLENLSKNIVNLATRKTGALIIIARQSSLEDLTQQENFRSFGELDIDKDIVEVLFTKGSPYSKGAMVIRDDKILGVNANLTVAKGKELRNAYGSNRIGAVYGSNTKYDCVVIAVSGSRGTITLGGRINGKKITDYEMLPKEFDMQRGISYEELEKRLQTYLLGFGEGDIYRDIENTSSIENKNKGQKGSKKSKSKKGNNTNNGKKGNGGEKTREELALMSKEEKIAYRETMKKERAMKREKEKQDRLQKKKDKKNKKKR